MSSDTADRHVFMMNEWGCAALRRILYKKKACYRCIVLFFFSGALRKHYIPRFFGTALQRCPHKYKKLKKSPIANQIQRWRAHAKVQAQWSSRSIWYRENHCDRAIFYILIFNLLISNICYAPCTWISLPHILLHLKYLREWTSRMCLTSDTQNCRRR